jgi:alkylation response protein AidB-like acyl-CoA dehydrogenase
MTPDCSAAAEAVAAVAGEHAVEVDTTASFPVATLAAARQHGLLGWLSSREVGGTAHGLRSAGEAVERLARECGSSAMVLTMHFCGTVVLEQFGPLAVRREIAAGRHLSTLAFSEAGSRSHFWAPVSTSRVDGQEAVLDARKSWITAARHADSYVWSSRPAAAEAPSTLWMVPRTAAGLNVAGAFDGLGLRGNESSPVTAEGVRVP